MNYETTMEVCAGHISVLPESTQGNTHSTPDRCSHWSPDLSSWGSHKHAFPLFTQRRTCLFSHLPHISWPTIHLLFSFFFKGTLTMLRDKYQVMVKSTTVSHQAWIYIGVTTTSFVQWGQHDLRRQYGTQHHNSAWDV